MITVVTSFSESGYSQYGKAFLESFVTGWPKEVNLKCYFHSNWDAKEPWVIPDDAPQADNIEYRALDSIEDLGAFKKASRSLFKNKFNKEYPDVDWRFDVVKFCNKVFAITHAVQEEKSDWLIWLDADTVTNKPISLKRLKSWLPDEADIVHLGRAGVTTYSETSFIGFNLAKDVAKLFVIDLIKLYTSGEFQFYTEWHDGFVFERLLNLSVQHGLITYNLSPNVTTLEAFKTSELGHFMYHAKGNLKNGPQVPQALPAKVPFTVTPVDCVAKEEISNNIKANMKLINRWLKQVKRHNGEALFVSGGPSIKDHIEEIRERQKNGAVIFSVKHSYPVLLENGIIPEFCCIIDPRPMDGVSTHGKVRRDLFKEINPKTTFLMASMSNPTATEFFLERGANVMGWHALTAELQPVLAQFKDIPREYTKSISFGTCSAIRMIGIADMLGFAGLTLVGYDCNVDEPQDKEELTGNGMVKYVHLALNPSKSLKPDRIFDDSIQPEEGERRFWSTGELVALYQDFYTTVPVLFDKGFRVEFLHTDKTLIGYSWKQMLSILAEQKKLAAEEENLKKQGPSWKQLIKDKTPLEFKLPAELYPEEVTKTQ